MTESTGPESTRDQMAIPLTRRTPKRSPSVGGFSLRPSPQIGIIIGHRYAVEGFLGEGGTATVYLARDMTSDRLVVIKRMKSEVAKTPELRQRFLLEARALACVDHPGVIRVLDIEERDDEPPYLALEALRGESLGDYLKREGVMSPELAVLLLRQAVRALAAVHEAGMVHRDIKPDNLYLVGPIGEPHSIKVLDFGMAHLPDEQNYENSTSILGTAQYMAPEQILVEPVDARTDIYALGVVMFRMLTGHLPFDANSKNDLLRHQLFSPVPPSNWLNDEIPETLERIIHKATRKSPIARFEHMDDMAEAFDGMIGVDAPPSSRRLSTIMHTGEPDIYHPRTDRGKKAAGILAREFGVYSRPHSPPPPPAEPE